MKVETKKLIIKSIIAGLLASLGVLAASFGLTSCHAARTITTTAETYHKGDTSVIIQTKTIESYTATKR